MKSRYESILPHRFAMRNPTIPIVRSDATGVCDMRTRIAGIILCCLVLAGQRAAAQELVMLQSDPSGCTIEYKPDVRFRQIRAERAVYMVPEFTQAVSMQSGKPGEPDMYFRTELVALPGLSGNRSTVVQADYEDRSDMRIAPIPEEREIQDGTLRNYIESATYNRSGFFPSLAADIAGVGIARDQILCNVRFFPVQWDPLRRVARVYTRIVVQIDYGAPDRNLTVRRKNEPPSPLHTINARQADQWVLRQNAGVRKSLTPVLVSPTAYRIEIPEEGLYRLNKSWFQSSGIDVAAFDPRTIRMFGNGGRELPQQIGGEKPVEAQELAIEVIGEVDGRFDDNDYVSFYAPALGGFAYDSSAGRYSHFIHRYDNTNSVLLTFGGEKGKRVASVQSENVPNAYKPTWFIGKEFVEDEVVNLMNSGKLWLSRKIDPRLQQAGAIVYARKLQDIDPAQPVLYRMKLYSQADRGTTNAFTISDGGPLGTVPMQTVDLSTIQGEIAATSGVVEFQRRGDLADGRTSLTISYSASDPDRNRGGYVDWVEWYYARKFLASGDALSFSAPDTTAVIAYELNGFTNSDILVYRITDYSNVERIANPTVSGGTVRFQMPTRFGRPEQYLALTSAMIKTPGPAARVELGSLKSTEGNDFLIITSPELAQAAGELKAYREQPGENFLSTRVVTMPEIYNEFNAGVVDPTAIRSFLAYAMEHWNVRPHYVLLFGDGHFDYKNRTTKELAVVPVWETENSIDLIASYPTDDYYAQVVGRDARVDIALGRIPVQTASEAADVVKKIIEYERSPDFGPWRNRITLVADDGITSGGDDLAAHTSQSEDLARSLPSSIEQNKIYIVAYRTENSAQGRRKPDANQAIIESINQGNVIMNYTGHGSDCVWAHEQIFVCDGTVPKLTNKQRLTFVSAATCTFGLYDRPDVRSGTEALILKPDGGSIGGLSSPRVVFSGQNSAFNMSFFSYAVNRGREANGRTKCIGDGLFGAKQSLFGDPGYEKFHLFGDPTLRLAFPRYTASVDELQLNDSTIVSDTVQFRALSKVTILGSIRKADNSVWTDFSGTTQIALFDAERNVPVPEWGLFTFAIPGGLLYRGQATIADGRFAISFIVPKDISYENNRGRLALYFDDGARDGAGFNNGFFIGGSDSSASKDTKGPDIALFLDTRNFREGDLVSEDALLVADFYDISGINTSGLGIGHNIEAWLDGSPNSIELNAYYKGLIDSYQRGTVEYPLRQLQTGQHTLTLRAWDIYNNSSTASTFFTVAQSDQLSLQHVMPYPNPMSSHTAFTFQHNLSEPVQVEITIYSVAGKRIKKISETDITDRFVQIPWDGRDDDDAVIANGVYLYKIVCRTMDGSRASERLDKLSVLR